jgi:hypothetical protein
MKKSKMQLFCIDSFAKKTTQRNEAIEAKKKMKSSSEGEEERGDARCRRGPARSEKRE